MPHWYFILVLTCVCPLSLFQELEDDKPLTPTNFQEYMKDQAKDTNALNEQVQQFKAVLQTRGEL